MAYTQNERMCQVTSPLGDDVLLLTGMDAQESISNPFLYKMQFASETEDIDFAAVIGKQVCARLVLGNGTERHFNGIVSRFSQGPTEGGFATYRAEVVPWISLLRRRAGCRIYQHKTVPDIIKALLTETDFGDVEFQLAGEFPEREYCVQYNETDFDFISRLAEEEGIGYFFKHSGKAHTLVLFNSPSAATPCPGQATVVYTSAVGLSVREGAISEFRVEHELASGKYSITDYNFEDPSMNLLTTTSSSTNLGGNEKFEIYAHPGEYLQLSEGERRVKLRMEAEEAAAIHIQGQSDCAGFVPGYSVELKGHFRSSYNKSYVITGVSHQARQDIGVGEAAGESSYSNTFSCIPLSVPFRPLQRTPKPLITGVQTATVVGAAGKEIDVDDHGRVVVQFHWDREGKRDENSSCRVRSSQAWAGKGWGSVSIPRIGQEVIVDFLEGDPNRPMITGRVYNGQNKLPYAGGGVVSGMKSSSTPGGNGSNEMSMDDTKGKEKITVHAQYDMATTVEHDQSTRVVSGNRTLDVAAGTLTETIKGSASLTVQAGSRTVSVSGGDYSATASAAVVLHGKGSGVSVTGNPNVDLKGTSTLSITSPVVDVGNDAITIHGTKIELKTAGGSILIDGAGVTIQGSTIKSNAAGNHEITGAIVKVNS